VSCRVFLRSPPATASAEGAQLNGRPFPASATAEGAQLNVPPSLWERALAQGEGLYNRTSILPTLSPLKSPMNAFGAFSMPATIVSCHLIFLALIHMPISL
jgi:hypothetical protein